MTNRKIISCSFISERNLADIISKEMLYNLGGWLVYFNIGYMHGDALYWPLSVSGWSWCNGKWRQNGMSFTKLAWLTLTSCVWTPINSHLTLKTNTKHFAFLWRWMTHSESVHWERHEFFYFVHFADTGWWLLLVKGSNFMARENKMKNGDVWTWVKLMFGFRFVDSFWIPKIWK